ncbi:MAG: FtsW/RodA/SpoVE family cell cycle protein [Bacilli bacterium]|nr:FtsW/RodA/SpoVE family cell cycle protein [Bacilli bacterium]
MKNLSKYKVDNGLLVALLLMAIVSITTIYSAEQLLPMAMHDLYIKQSIWFIIGFIVAYSIMSLGNEIIYKNVWLLYGLGIAMLLLLLIFGTPINGAKCWVMLPGIGSVQPSEFMKIILIITLAHTINNFNERKKEPTVAEELKFLTHIAILVLIPTILTFLQPDTGMVIIYLIITLVMLFISGIRYGWFIFFFGSLILALTVIISLYFFQQDLFIKLFGTNLFYRLDRLLDWSSGIGMQLKNSITVIGAAGLTGYGFAKTPLYFPEPHTDFIFAVFSSNYGLIGSILLIALLLFFNYQLLNLTTKNISNINKYLIAGVFGMLVYQQIQSIAMTIGLLPITGITLPFISYGGSSLLSYMIMIGIVFNISNQSIRFTN